MEVLVPCSLEQVPKGAMGLTCAEHLGSVSKKWAWGRVLQGHPNSQGKSQEIPICSEEVAKASISHIPFLCLKSIFSPPLVHAGGCTCCFFWQVWHSHAPFCSVPAVARLQCP